MITAVVLLAPFLLPQQASTAHAGAPRAAGPVQTVPKRVLWRYTIPSTYVHHRPAVARDGTIYVNDISGKVHALSPEGRLRWTFDLQGQGAQGPCAVGADGSVYVVGDPGGPTVSLFALRSDGTLKWVFSDSGAQGVIAGPGVGPDGNVYVTTEDPGAGLISLTPDGDVRWTRRAAPNFTESGQLGAELAFGSSFPGGPGDRVFLAFDMVGMGTGPRLFAYDLDGSQVFSVLTGAQTDLFLQPQCQPVCAPSGRVHVSTSHASTGWVLESFDSDDGEVLTQYSATPANGMSPPSFDPAGNAYLVRSLTRLAAVSPGGHELWNWTDGSVLYGPVVSPDGTQLVLGGLPNFGQPGFLRAFDTQGTPLWKVVLPVEIGPLVPDTRATFAPGGNAAYVVATQPAGGTGAPSFLYALDTRR